MVRRRLVGFAGARGGTVLWLKRNPVAKAAQLTPLAAPQLPGGVRAGTARGAVHRHHPGGGIEFVHNNGAYGDKLLPESMGGGAAFPRLRQRRRPGLVLRELHLVARPRAAGAQPTTHDCMPTTARDASPTSPPVLASRSACMAMGCAAGDFDNDARWMSL